MDTPVKPESAADLRDYLAGERTFLAWIRTGLALMGFGFVLAHFGIFADEPGLSQVGNSAPPIERSQQAMHGSLQGRRVMAHMAGFPERLVDRRFERDDTADELLARNTRICGWENTRLETRK
jgi:uncharacterized membrane protein YidH (DUF202 family)